MTENHSDGVAQCADILTAKESLLFLRQEVQEIKIALKDRDVRDEANRMLLTQVVTNQRNIADSVKSGFAAGSDKMSKMSAEISQAKGGLAFGKWLGSVLVAVGVGVLGITIGQRQ